MVREGSFNTEKQGQKKRHILEKESFLNMLYFILRDVYLWFWYLYIFLHLKSHCLRIIWSMIPEGLKLQLNSSYKKKCFFSKFCLVPLYCLLSVWINFVLIASFFLILRCCSHFFLISTLLCTSIKFMSQENLKSSFYLNRSRGNHYLYETETKNIWSSDEPPSVWTYLGAVTAYFQDKILS